MVILIMGGSGSGKSAFAEKCVMDTGIEKKYYLATMQVYGEEGLKKVERHKQLRSGKGFITIERQTRIELAANELPKESSVVLLECMSNLVANEMFTETEMYDSEYVVNKVINGMKELIDKADTTVIVTNNVFEDGIEYDHGTKEYMKALGTINQKLAVMADTVYEVVVGIPVKIKEISTV